MKYGRPIDCGDGADKRRMTDVVEMPPALPAWAVDDEAWLSKMYENQKPSWESAGQWFVHVPDGVQSGAVHTGSNFEDPLSYLNPDGTAGDGLTEEQRNPPEGN